MEPGRYLVLFYDYVENVVERRAPHRQAHLEHVGRLKADGRVVAGGALGDPPHGAAIVFHVDDPAEVEAFVEADPYISAGLVTAWRVEPWTVET